VFGYFKGEPGEYVIHHVRGRVKHEGAGLAFWFFRPTASLTLVPLTTVDTSFIFNEVTKNFQGITIQGQVTYRIRDPKRIAESLDFTVDPRSRARRSKDPERLGQRIVNVVKRRTQELVRTASLEEALHRAGTLAAEVLAALEGDPELTKSGIECSSLHFLSVQPTPEMAKALEAEFRESLQRKADEAIYARRAAAVEQERKIKENELATEVTLEQRRRELLELKAANAEKEATYRAKVATLELAPYAAVDSRTLMALAFRDIGQNAQKIGNLAITPDLLATLLQTRA
jgi:hypothetical protein